MATQAELSTELLNTWLAFNPETQLEGITNFVTAYDNWAKTLKDSDGGLTGDLLKTSNNAGAIALLQSLNPDTGTATSGSQTMEEALQSYWVATFDTIVPSTGFSTETTSTATPPVVGSLAPPMVVWINTVMAGDPYAYSKEQAADAMAELLYTSTLTVVATIVGFDTTSPPNGPLAKTEVTGIG